LLSLLGLTKIFLATVAKIEIEAGLAARILGLVAFNYAQCTVKMVKSANYAPQNAAVAE